jgi:hypothetical protein
VIDDEEHGPVDEAGTGYAITTMASPPESTHADAEREAKEKRGHSEGADGGGDDLIDRAVEVIQHGCSSLVLVV